MRKSEAYNFKIKVINLVVHFCCDFMHINVNGNIKIVNRKEREKAEFLAQAFSSVFVNEPKSTPDVEIPALSNYEMLTDVVISHADLKKELEGLNRFKSIGPDNIHPKLLRLLADDNSSVFALAKLFCVIIDTGKLPNIWKSAIFKKYNHI